MYIAGTGKFSFEGRCPVLYLVLYLCPDKLAVTGDKPANPGYEVDKFVDHQIRDVSLEHLKLRQIQI